MNESGLLHDKKAIVCSARLFVESLLVARSILLKWDYSIRCSIPRLTRSGTGKQACFAERTYRARIHPRPHPRQTYTTVQVYSRRRTHHNRKLDSRCCRILDMRTLTDTLPV